MNVFNDVLIINKIIFCYLRFKFKHLNGKFTRLSPLHTRNHSHSAAILLTLNILAQEEQKTHHEQELPTLPNAGYHKHHEYNRL